MNVAESKTSPKRSQPRRISHRRKPIYERLATLTSLTALVVGLVAALGFPAATLQFTRLNIPTELLSYGRSLRAGIIPTLMLVIGFMVLRLVGRSLAGIARKITKRGRTDDEQENDGVLSYLKLLLVLPFVLWFFAFFVAAVITFVWWPFVFFRYVWRTFGSIWALALIIFCITLSIMVQVIFWRLINRNRQRVEKYQASLIKRHLKDNQDAFAIPFQGTYAAFAFGGWHLLVAFTLQKILQEFSIEPRFWTTTVSLLASALWGLVIGAIFYVGFSLRAFASKRSKIRRLAWLEIGAYTLLAYLVLVIVYSTSVYWRMPPFLGGGHPQAISVWFDASGSQMDLNRQLPRAQCTRSGDDWMCASAYLVDGSGDALILVDGESPTSSSLVISKSKVRALTSVNKAKDETLGSP